VAALTGFRPVAGDPGQPVRLALNSVETRTAEASPAVELPPVPAYEPEQVAQSIAQPISPPAALAEAAPAPQFAEAPAPAPTPVEEQPAAEPPTAAKVVAAVAAAVAEVPSALAEMAGYSAPKKSNSVTRRVPLRNASLQRADGNSTAVVQLGAYASRERVATAWEILTKRYPNLRDHSPMIARFDSKRGTVYRLSIKGFGSQQEAIARCRALRGKGGSCFVRNVAGDTPVQIASR
jgi:hypothetical protein